MVRVLSMTHVSFVAVVGRSGKLPFQLASLVLPGPTTLARIRHENPYVLSIGGVLCSKLHRPCRTSPVYWCSCSVLPLPFRLIHAFPALPSLLVFFRLVLVPILTAPSPQVSCIPYLGQELRVGSLSVRYTDYVSKTELRVVLCPKIYGCRQRVVRANLFLNPDCGVRPGWPSGGKSELSNPPFPSALMRFASRSIQIGGRYH